MDNTIGIQNLTSNSYRAKNIIYKCFLNSKNMILQDIISRIWMIFGRSSKSRHILDNYQLCLDRLHITHYIFNISSQSNLTNNHLHNMPHRKINQSKVKILKHMTYIDTDLDIIYMGIHMVGICYIHFDLEMCPWGS